MLATFLVSRFFHGLRAAEELLPPQALAVILRPPVVMISFFRAIGKAGRSRKAIFARAFGTPPDLSGTVRALIGETYGRLITLWPDRFTLPRWKPRFTATGLDRLLECRAEGRPVVLAIIHFQHMNLLRLFLRANGLPVASLTYRPGVTAVRRSINAAVDRSMPLADTPHKFTLEQLRSAYAFLRSGNCLLIACDRPSNDTITLPTAQGTIGIHLGPFRLASMTDAVVVPALALQERPWKFRIALGEPTLPPAHSSDRSAFEPLAKHCLATWQAMIEDHPDQLDPMRGVWNMPGEIQPA